MKKALCSLRIFTAQYTITSLLQILASFLLAFGVVSLMSLGIMISIEASEDSFIAGFLSSFIPGMTVVFPLMGVFLLNAMYSYNMPTNPGYKYLHSIADSSKHFKNTIIVSNIAAAILGFVSLLLVWLIGIAFSEIIISPLGTLAISFGGIGLVNFTGYLKNQWARLISILPMCGIAGFVVGFTAAAEEDGEEIPAISDNVMLIVVAVCIVLAIAGFIFSMKKCEKKWREDK